MQSALAALNGRPADTVTVEIVTTVTDLVDQVWTELNGQTTDFLAATFAADAMGDASEAPVVDILTGLAVEWDLDPDHAAEVLGRMAGSARDASSDVSEHVHEQAPDA